jgi:O-antigen/teichoic acid export membrane protein
MPNMIKKSYQLIFEKINYLIDDGTITKRIITNSFWTVFGGVISKFIGLIGAIFLGRILGAEDYGGYGVILSTIDVFAMFSGAGMGLTAIKYIAKYKGENDKEKVGGIINLTLLLSLIMSVLLSVIMFSSSELIGAKILLNDELVGPLKIISLSLFFSTLNGVIMGILSGFEKFKTISLMNLIFGFINYPLILIFAYNYGLYGAVLGYAVSQFIFLIVYFSVFKKIISKLGYKIRWRIKLLKEYKFIIMNYSLPAIFAGSLMAPMIWLSNIIFLKSENAYELIGFFQAGNQLKLLVIFFPMMLTNILLPILSSVENKEKYRNILKATMYLNLAIALVLCIPLVLFSSFFMGLYGNDFAAHNVVLIIMAGTAVVITYNSVIGKSIASSGNMWYGLIFNLFWGIILLIGTYITVRYSFGAEGLAFAYLIAYLFHSIWQTIYLKEIKVI